MSWKLEEAVEYYRRQGAPADQSALKALLFEVQDNGGGSISSGLIPEIAQRLGVKENLVLAMIRRIPRLRLKEVHVLELCAGPNCGKHRALAEAAEKLTGGSVELRYIPCQRMCGKGPNIRYDGKLYHRADEMLLRKLLKNL